VDKGSLNRNLVEVRKFEAYLDALESRFDERNFNLIKNNKIAMGISEQVLTCSWGAPNRINDTVGHWGAHRQYVYGSGQYVYVENGVVKSWQSF
jgi:hypothetical protein